MPANDNDFYNGLVLNRLLKSEKKITLQSFPTKSNNSFVVNNNIGLYIKYTKKSVSPWRFSFIKEHQEEMSAMFDLLDKVYLILVCAKDGIVCLKYEAMKIVLNEYYEEMEWISASRLSGQKYTIKGKDGQLKYKIGDSDFPKKIFEE